MVEMIIVTFLNRVATPDFLTDTIMRGNLVESLTENFV